MNFKEFIKNPSQFIWEFIDKIRGLKTTGSTANLSSLEPVEKHISVNANPVNIKEVITADIKGFLIAIESKDWKWLFRGKTGLFLKISLPLLLFFYIISFAIPSSRMQGTPVNPPKQDPGDILQKPQFVSSNYLNGSFNDNKFLVYSKDANAVNEFGLRGILLGSTPIEKDVSYYYPINKQDFVTFKDSSLILSYIKRVKQEFYPYKVIETVEEVSLLEGVGALEELANIHKTYEGNLALVYNSKLYVFNSTGDKIKEFKLSDSDYSPSYYNGEVYFLKKVDPFKEILDTSSETLATISAIKPNYYLVKLNRNDEEVYSQELGDTRPQKVTVVNDDRFLLLFEKPSTDTFFNIQMRDSAKRIIFNIIPKETDVKITLANNLYFSNQDNTIFIQGNGVAKLFNLNGEQLWIN